MGRLILVSAVSILLLTSVSLARTWYVTPDGSGDAVTIQASIDSASAGDTVLVAAATYTGVGNRNLDFGGTDLVLLSEAGPELTTIDCEGSGRGFYFHSGESGAAVVEGFTVTNGYITAQSPDSGGGIGCDESSPTISNCTFSGNTGGYGGGMYCERGSSPTVRGCTFYGNSADSGGGMCCSGWSYPSYPLIENTIIAFSPQGQGVHCEYGGSATLTCCDVHGNAGGDWVGCIADQSGINGNFSACPSFCNAEGGDFTLCDESPCLPGNHPEGYDCGLIGAWDVGCICGPSATETATWGGIKSIYR